MARRLTAVQWVRLIANGIRHSEIARSIKVLPGFFPYRRLRQPAGPLLIDIETRMGMGAILSLALRLHNWAAHLRIDAEVISTSPLYSEGADVLARFFERPGAASGHRVSSLAREWIYRNEAPVHVPLSEAVDLFARLFKPNAYLLALLDQAAGGKEPFDLSIHFRAT